MAVTRCMNCDAPVTFDDLIVMYGQKIVGAVCTACTEGVRKPRITLTREVRNGTFSADQYSAVEIFNEHR